jgi:hypothetical protein
VIGPQISIVIREKNDDWFYFVLKEISPHLLTNDSKEFWWSIALSPEVLLAATLRFLAGGNYIDLLELTSINYFFHFEGFPIFSFQSLVPLTTLSQ